jgi:arsenite methyltransferase
MTDEQISPAPPEARPPEPSYGIDAPSVVLTFTVLGVVSFFGACFAAGGNSPPLVVFFLLAMLSTAPTAAYMVYSSTKAKKRLWQRTLDGLDLTGAERTLDVGCGRGLVLIETAKRVPEGHATGIDLWRSKDQSGNTRSITEANATSVGVADRVDVRDGDMRELPFSDESFDLVTASLAIHNIGERVGRNRAVEEVARVLAPGGRIVIIDIGRTNEYEAELARAGLTDVRRSGLSFVIYPPVRTVTAHKSSTATATTTERPDDDQRP